LNEKVKDGYAKDSYGQIYLRLYQKEAINFIVGNLMEGKTPLVESPTGSGKTIISIISAVLFAKKTGKKILYLTRTNSQQEQILSEINALAKELDFRAIAMQGRTNMCPLYMEIETESGFTPESLSKMCTSKKKRSKEGKEGGCYYYNSGINSEETKEYILNKTKSPEEIFEVLKNRVICPYESIKYAMRDADMVVMPYANYVNDNIALTQIYNWRTSRENILLIIDEAHNLPDIARESNSLEITQNMINISEKEAIEFGDPELLPNIHISDFTEALRETLVDISRDMNEKQTEKRIMFRDVYEYLGLFLKMNLEEVEYLVESFITYGMQVEEQKEAKGKVPLSHIKTLGDKLKFLQIAETDRFICIISKEKEEKIEAYCLDPSIVLESLLKSPSIHISATLSPVLLYTNMIGISNYSFKSIENVFPKENLLTIYSDELTTKYSELTDKMLDNYANQILEIIENIKRKTIVFFPSYNLLKQIASRIHKKEILLEDQRMMQRDFRGLLLKFKEKTFPLFAVMGGRLSEGINLPGNLLELEVIVGIPFPKPTIKQRALSAYYDFLYGSGWEYAFLFPAIIKVRQTSGRVIRSSEDRGCVVVLDGRVEILEPYVKVKRSENVLKDITDFFNS
jgi:DNA excision repair protein ERCC-2